MSTCTKCGNTLNEKHRCEPCTRQYQKEYRAKNKDRHNELNRLWRINNKENYNEKKYAYYSTIKGRMVELVSRSKRRANNSKIPHTLTSDFIEKMWHDQQGKCAITSIPFVIPQDRTCGKGTPFAPSINRIDCSKGYTPDNVRIVCLIVNYALNEFGEAPFKTMCESYVKHAIIES